MPFKIRRNSAVFKQVARALGARRALRELRKVAEYPYSCSDFNPEASCVASSFYWSQAPQDSAFWVRCQNTTATAERD